MGDVGPGGRPGIYVAGPGHWGSRCIDIQGQPYSMCTMAQGEGGTSRADVPEWLGEPTANVGLREGRRTDHASFLVNGLCQGGHHQFPDKLANQPWNLFQQTLIDVLAGAARSRNLA